MEQQKQKGETLNVPEKMINQLIAQTEEKILNMRMRMESLEPEIQKWEQQIQDIFQPLKNDYLEMEAVVLEDEKMLEVLVGFRDNPNDKKKIRVMRSVSNVTVKSKRPRKYDWMHYALTILREANFFMSAEHLVNKIYLKFPEVKNAGEVEMMKHKIVGNFIRSATVPASKKIIMYNKKIGLPEWVDKNGIVKPEHLTKVMKSA